MYLTNVAHQVINSKNVIKMMHLKNIGIMYEKAFILNIITIF